MLDLRLSKRWLWKASRIAPKCRLAFNGLYTAFYHRRENSSYIRIRVPATEHGHFVVSWWRTPLRHNPNVTRFYFQQTSGIHAPVGKRKVYSLSSKSPTEIADSFHVATMARKHSVLNLQEINRNNTHTALASVLNYYGWVSSIFWFIIKISTVLAMVRL
jgi:hypothetical protein